MADSNELVDPNDPNDPNDQEEFDASEQQFAASLEDFATASASTPNRFTTKFTIENINTENISTEKINTEKFNTEKINTEKFTAKKFKVERTMEPAIDSMSDAMSGSTLASMSDSISPRLPQAQLPPTETSTGINTEISTKMSDASELGSASASEGESVSGSESASPDEWRDAVAATIHRYRARGKARPPRYPSLMLNFDPPEPLWSSSSTAEVRTSVASSQIVSPRTAVVSEPAASFGPSLAVATDDVQAEPIRKILEFPRPAATLTDELAEPVQSRPRIMEAQEAVPPPPALGGIVMEEREPSETTPAHLTFEVPVQVASPWRRALAAAIDFFLVGAAFAIFAAVALRFTGAIFPRTQLIAAAATVLAALWSCYQYLLVVSTGNTPGLRMMKLRLLHIDGAPVSRQMRRCRVLASLLSAASLGLGYLWCFLDEDRLCWHDRITHSYLTSR